MDQPWLNQAQRFCRQYLQVEPDLDFPDADCLCLDHVQEFICRRAFIGDAADFGPPERYRLRVLKELVSRIESSIEDWDKYAISDELMGQLSMLLSTPLPSDIEAAQKKCYVTYELVQLDCAKLPNKVMDHGEDKSILLLENRNLIAAGGTTGLRTWEAALHMGQYLSRNPSIVSGKRILELGAGTGYLSILCARHLQAAHVIASDGSDDVVNSLADNIFLNNLQGLSSEIVPMDLKWGHMLSGGEESHWNGGRSVDVVLGADVTYDYMATTALVATIADLFDLFPQLEVYISATERNEHTFRVFPETCHRNGLAVKDVEFHVCPQAEQNGPFYSDKVAIRIYHITKATRHKGKGAAAL